MSDTADAPDKVQPKAAPVDFVPAYILRNRGVPITLLRLENGALPALDPDDEEATYPERKAWLRFTANHVATFEDVFDGIVARVQVVETRKVLDGAGQPIKGPAGYETEDIIVGYEDRAFYGQEAFQQALQTKVVSTCRKILSVCLDMSEEEAGLAMDPVRSQEYQTAVGVAWSIAMGVDPTDAAKILQQGLAAVGEGRANLASQFEKMMGVESDETDAPSPGPTGPPPGPASDDPS